MVFRRDGSATRPRRRSATRRPAARPAAPPPDPPPDLIDPWILRSRVESLAGEARVNLVRLAAVFAFYLRHLIAMAASEGSAAEAASRYHVGATIVAGAWFAVVGAIHVCLSRRYLPAWTPTTSTSAA